MPGRTTMRLAFLVALLGSLAAAATGAARADEGLAAEREAAETIRAALPEPTPAISIRYEGDILVDGLFIGEIEITARAAKVGRQSVWRVTQSSFHDLGVRGEVRTRTKLHLARDLAILSGTFEMESKTETVSLVMSRIEQGFMVQRRVKKGDDWNAPEVRELAAPARATGGIAAALLFLRALPADATGAFALPWVGTEEWLMRGTSKAHEPAVLAVGGESTFESPAKRRDSWFVTSKQGAESPARLHLSRDRRTLLGIVGREGTKMRVVPRGEGGSRDVELKGDAPAATWKAAFLKFGYGYHMARPELLEAAFHWERMYAYETEVLKRWPADRPLDEFKKAWVDEFVANSKRRSLADTKRLLAMTLSTGKVKSETADAVVFAAHPNFGGGVQRTYHLEKREGVWGITRIDF
jgi:hypothetical protein